MFLFIRIPTAWDGWILTGRAWAAAFEQNSTFKLHG